MRRFVLLYVILALIFSATTVILQIEPATTVISWVVESDGSFKIIIPLAILFLGSLLPLFLIMLIWNIFSKKKGAFPTELLDQTGVIIKRDKGLYGAIFPIDVLADGQKVASVSMGQQRAVNLPIGNHLLQVKAMGKASGDLEIEVSDAKPVVCVVGFRTGGTIQDVYIELDQTKEVI
jgi:hypothetical protein